MTNTKSDFDEFENQESSAQVSDVAGGTTAASPIDERGDIDASFEEIDIPTVGLSATIDEDVLGFNDVEPPVLDQTVDEFTPDISTLEEPTDTSLEAALGFIDRHVESTLDAKEDGPAPEDPISGVDLSQFTYTLVAPTPSEAQEAATVKREGSDVESDLAKVRVSGSSGAPRLIVTYQNSETGKDVTRSAKVGGDLPAAYERLTRRIEKQGGPALPNYASLSETLEQEYANTKNDILAAKIAESRSVINMQIRAVDSDLASVVHCLERGTAPARKVSIERFAAPKRKAFELDAPLIVTNPETGKPENLPAGTLIAATSSPSRLSIIPPGSGLAKSIRAHGDLHPKDFDGLGVRVHKPLRVALSKINTVQPSEVAEAAQTLSQTSPEARERGLTTAEDILLETNVQTAKEHDAAQAADEQEQAEYQRQLEEYEEEQERLRAQGRSSKGGALAGLFQQSSGKKPMPPTSLSKDAVHARIKAANESGLAAALTFDHAAENYERAVTQYADAVRRRGLANETPDSQALASFLETREGKRVAADLSQANAIVQQTFSPEAISKQGQKLMETSGQTVQQHYQEKLAEAASRISSADKSTGDVPKLDGGALKELQETLSELTEKLAELFKSLNPLRKS